MTWSVLKEAGPAALVLKWQESGGPKVAATDRRGFGSTVVERGVAYEMEGSVQMEFAPAGLVVTLKVPLAKVVPVDGGIGGLPAPAP